MTNKYVFRTMRRERITFIIAALLFSIVSGILVMKTSPPKTIKVGLAYIPPASIFGLQNITSFVSSPYYYESSLVNYSVPVADSDYILPVGSTELVRLPGYSNNRYTFVRTGYISGSGWFETWTTPNGGYIAFVHLSSVSIASRREVSAIATTLDAGKIEKHCRLFTGDKKKNKLYNQYCLNDDRTGIVANQLIRQSQPSVTASMTQTGGYIVGRTGWPTDPFYGNGLAGPYNAHLCLIYDQAGANWLSYVTYQPRPRPQPKPVTFNFKLWYSWHIKHHKPNISPYYHGKLSAIAQVWKSHTGKCNSATRQYVYNRRGRYSYQRFQSCMIFIWDKNRFSPKIRGEKYIS